MLTFSMKTYTQLFEKAYEKQVEVTKFIDATILLKMHLGYGRLSY